MSHAKRMFRVQVTDGGIECEEGIGYLQTVSFHRTTRELSFGRFHRALGDMGGQSINSHFCFALPVGDQPNMLWDAGEGHIGRDNVRDGDSFLYLAHRPTYLCTERMIDFLALFVDPSYLHQCAWESIDPDRIELLGQGCLRDPFLNGVLTTLRRECERHGMIDRLYCESLATALCVHTLRNYTALRPTLLDLSNRGLGTVALKEVRDFISDNLHQDLGLSDIAASVSLSPHNFSRLFKQSVGQTPYQYVIAQRVEKAKALLLRGRMTVGEVAQAVGFYDHSHLIRHLKKRTGLIPSDYRG